MSNIVKGAVLLFMRTVCLSGAGVAQPGQSLRSPDQRIEVRIQTGDRLTYTVLLGGKALLRDGTISINIDRQTLGASPNVKAVKRDSVNREIEPAVRQKSAKIRESYNELRLEMEGGYAVVFPPYPLKEEFSADRNKDRDFRVTQAADYIAVTRGTRTFPWRLLGISERDGDLLTNQLVYLLASPPRVRDTSWIRPGKVAWDWWNANNVHGVDFKSGVNTETYKYFIDFASAHGIEYVIL
ncbi:MAG: glycoside hydrolase family 97 N-terminal domain-containing protein, partial [Pyrinomonadaceae bacterium]